MTIKSLDGEDILNICTTFQESFSDYVIPFNLTLTQLEDKIKAENIQLKYSIGAYTKDRLVAFILHAVEQNNGIKQLYNAGTGVIPSQRGENITQKMYQKYIPIFKQMGVNSISLEVIEGNEPAIKTYTKVGFKMQRDLYCYSGAIKTVEPALNLSIKPISPLSLLEINEVDNLVPSWQNSMATIRRIEDKAIILGLFDTNELVGYLALNKSNNRILQIGILKKHRKKKYGTLLLQHIKMNYSTMTSITNVHSENDIIQKFLIKNGLTKSITQHEMLFTL